MASELEELMAAQAFSRLNPTDYFQTGSSQQQKKSSVNLNTSSVTSKTANLAFDPIHNVSLPLNTNNLLETFLAASKVGEVFPYFVRQVLLVKAGTVGELNISIPTGDTAAAVYLVKLHVDNHSSDFLATFQADSLPPLFVEQPMNYDIDILGSFLPPAYTQVVQTLINNDTIDITFTADVQLAVMTSNFSRTVYEPLLKGQYELLRKLAGQFTNYRGGGSN